MANALVITILVTAPLALLAAGAVARYNLLVRDRARVAAAWSDVEVQLKRRYDVVPKLVEVARQHAAFERKVLERLARERSQALSAQGPRAKRAPESALVHDLHRLFAVAEAYPDLKASGSFVDLQRNLSEVEEQIQFARRYYNGAVNNLNTRVETFPDLLIAALFGFHSAEYFELDSAVEALAVDVT